MQLIHFRTAESRTLRPGVLQGDRVIDTSEVLAPPDPGSPDLGFVDRFDLDAPFLRELPDRLSSLPDHSFEDVALAAPVPRPGTTFVGQGQGAGVCCKWQFRAQ